MKECCRPRLGSNPRPPGLQSDAHPTEPLRPCSDHMYFHKLLNTREKNIEEQAFQHIDLDDKSKLRYQYFLHVLRAPRSSSSLENIDIKFPKYYNGEKVEK